MTDALVELVRSYGPWLLAVLGIVVAAVANGAETGLYRVNRVRLRLRADAGGGNGQARTLQALLTDLRGMIIVCLLGYDGGVYLTTVVATTLVSRSGWVDSALGVEVLTTAILTPLFFVLTDVTPKSIFAVEADRWMYTMARPLRLAYGALRAVGLVQALKGISNVILRMARHRQGAPADPFTPRQRLSALLRESAAEGVISGYQGELVQKVLTLREKTVAQVMIPLAQVAAVPADITREAFMEELRRHSFSRLPVYRGQKENVLGILRINDVLALGADRFDIGAVMSTEYVTVPPDATVSQALFRLRRSRAAIAVVADSRGRALGIITIKDLVEEIVGELGEW